MVNIVIGKSRLSSSILLLIGVALQVTGVGLMSSMNGLIAVPKAIFTYQILAGLGVGIIFGLCLILPPATIKSEDLGTFSTEVLFIIC